MNFREFIEAKELELNRIRVAAMVTESHIHAAMTVKDNVEQVKQQISSLTTSIENLPEAIKIAVKNDLLTAINNITSVSSELIKAEVYEDAGINHASPIISDLFETETKTEVETEVEAVGTVVEKVEDKKPRRTQAAFTKWVAYVEQELSENPNRVFEFENELAQYWAGTKFNTSKIEGIIRDFKESLEIDQEVFVEEPGDLEDLGIEPEVEPKIESEDLGIVGIESEIEPEELEVYEGYVPEDQELGEPETKPEIKTEIKPETKPEVEPTPKKSRFSGKKVTLKDTTEVSGTEVVEPIEENITLGGISTTDTITLRDKQGVSKQIPKPVPVGTKLYDTIIDCVYMVVDWDEAEIANPNIKKVADKIPVVSLFDERLYSVVSNLEKIVLVNDQEADDLIISYKKRLENIAAGDVFA